MRYRDGLAAFAASQRLVRTQKELSTLNEELEARVQEQVLQTLERGREVEALTAKLRLEVRERAIELARTLERLDRGFDDAHQGMVLADRVRLERQIGGAAWAPSMRRRTSPAVSASRSSS